MNEQRPPTPENLGTDEIAAIKAGIVTKVEQLGDEWSDDSVICVALRVHIEERKPIDMSLWWCGPVIVGALRYADESPRAMADILKEIRTNFD